MIADETTPPEEEATTHVTIGSNQAADIASVVWLWRAILQNC